MPVPDISSRSIEELISLRGRNAVVTGGAQGIGFSICRRLAEAGASIAIGDAPDDIARVVLFCASDLSLLMTGSVLLVDAGEAAV